MRQIPLSIIIPTFNEEKYLPKLLASIRKQTVQPKEIIVVDNFSKDKTVQYAEKFKCKIILNRAWIGGARNIGGNIAVGPLLLFLDADVILPPKFLEEVVKEFTNKKLGIASCFSIPLSSLKRDKLMHVFLNYYTFFLRDIYPYVNGSCILTTKKIHSQINGFDESLVMAEDHDYAIRASKHGKFYYLRSQKIFISVRRLIKEGRLKLALKYAKVELHRIYFKKIKKPLFAYKFGDHV